MVHPLKHPQCLCCELTGECRQVWVDVAMMLHHLLLLLLLLSTAETGVGATAAFLISGWWLVRIVPAAVLWREDEGTGSGDRNHISLCEERYGGPGGHTEQGSRSIGPSVAGRQGCTGCVAEGAG